MTGRARPSATGRIRHGGPARRRGVRRNRGFHVEVKNEFATELDARLAAMIAVAASVCEAFPGFD